MNLEFVACEVFRETPNVTFFAADVAGTNGSDVVIHQGRAISPPDIDGSEQYYVHRNQIDHNLVIQGTRTFHLLNPEWDEPNHLVFLNRKMGALKIPQNTFHRSISGPLGSIVLNQAIRGEEFDAKKEFSPVNIFSRNDLLAIKIIKPIIWCWSYGRILRKKDSGLRTVDIEKDLLRLVA